jgi:hypothetical protein
MAGTALHYAVVAVSSVVALMLLVASLNYGFVPPVGDHMLVRLSLWAILLSPALFVAAAVSSDLGRWRTSVDVFAVAALALYGLALATA